MPPGTPTVCGELEASTKFTADESGQAMGYMGMAGWNAQQMLAGMPGVLDLAGVAGIVTDKASPPLTRASLWTCWLGLLQIQHQCIPAGGEL